MRKVWAVMRREIMVRVRSRAFVIATVAGPLLMAFFFALPALLAGQNTVKHLVVLDAASGDFGVLVTEELRDAVFDSATDPTPRYRVERVEAAERMDAVRDSLVALTGVSAAGGSALDGILVLTDSTLVAGEITYFGTDVGDPSDMARLERTLRPVVLRERLARAEVEPRVALAAVQPVDLETMRVSDGRLTGESGEASFILAYLMAFVLYLALLLYGMQVMMSVLEEKSSRVIEVLASRISPFQLLLGKVFGVGTVGLLQLAIWAGTAMILTTYRVEIAGVLGMPPASAAELPIPTVTPALLAVFLAFFALGFLLYAAAYAAVGAMCGSQQETQQAQLPVTLFIGVGLVTMFSLLGDPNGTVARVLGFLPPFAPFVIPVRYSLSPLPLSVIVMAAIATTLGTLAVVWVAARIYRVGILSYGKRPTIAELWRWVRTA